MESKSGVMEASKELFYEKVATMSISLDSLDDSHRDLTELIFEEPAIDSSHFPVKEQNK